MSTTISYNIFFNAGRRNGIPGCLDRDIIVRIVLYKTGFFLEDTHYSRDGPFSDSQHCSYTFMFYISEVKQDYTDAAQFILSQSLITYPNIQSQNDVFLDTILRHMIINLYMNIFQRLIQYML